MYSEHVSEGWDRHRTISKVVFEKDYENWVPEHDLIILRWKEGTDPGGLTMLGNGLCFGGRLDDN